MNLRNILLNISMKKNYLIQEYNKKGFFSQIFFYKKNILILTESVLFIKYDIKCVVLLNYLIIREISARKFEWNVLWLAQHRVHQSKFEL